MSSNSTFKHSSDTKNSTPSQARECFDDGNENEARQIIVRYRCASNQSASDHAAWACLCEDLGMAKPAVDSWQRAVALENNNSDYLYHLGLLLYERGSLEKARKFLQRAIDCNPEHLKAKQLLSELYESAGEIGASRALAVRLSEKEPDSAHNKITFDPAIHIDDTTKFLQLFRGKEHLYAVQELDQAGRSLFVNFNAVLKADQVFDHIRGRKTIAVYPLREDSTLRFASVDVGINRRKLFDNLKNKGLRSLLHEKAVLYARDLITACANLSLPVYLTDNSEYGRRIWFLFDSYIPGILAERFCQKLIECIPEPSSDLEVSVKAGVQIEADGWKSSPLILPFGYDRKSGIRAFFRDIQDTIERDQLGFLKKIKCIRSESVRLFLHNAEAKGIPKLSEFSNTPKALKKLSDCCCVINEVVRKSRSGRSLTENEKLVIYHTLGLLPDNKASLHYALELTGNYKPQRTDRQAEQIRKNPISCPKIRQLLPEITAYVNCDCRLTIPKGKYPNPLLHVQPNTENIEAKAIQDDFYMIDDAVRRYVFLKNESLETQKAIKRIERRIRNLMEQQQSDKVVTSYGTVKLSREKIELEH